MGVRRDSRLAAVQVLYALDLAGGEDDPAGAVLRHFDHLAAREPTPELVRRTEALVQGAVARREAIDRVIAAASENWRISRMSCVDRNILRLATHELLDCPDVPPRVVINEAIELGKRLGAENSAAFINGVLDRVRRDLDRRRAR